MDNLGWCWAKWHIRIKLYDTNMRWQINHCLSASTERGQYYHRPHTHTPHILLVLNHCEKRKTAISIISRSPRALALVWSSCRGRRSLTTLTIWLRCHRKSIFSRLGAPVNSWMEMLHVDLFTADCGLASQSFCHMEHWNPVKTDWVIIESRFSHAWKHRWIVEWTCCKSIYPRPVGAVCARHFDISHIQIDSKMGDAARQFILPQLERFAPVILIYHTFKSTQKGRVIVENRVPVVIRLDVIQTSHTSIQSRR
jgi:hypothetical protein